MADLVKQPDARVPVVRAPSARALARGRNEANLAVLEFQAPTATLLATPMPLAARGTVWVVASLVVACGAAMGLIPIDKVVTASGKIVSQSPTLNVQALETSIVRSINVQEGQVVHAGDVLARLDPTFTAADAGSTAEQAAGLQAEVDRLKAEVADVPYQPAAKTTATEMQSAMYAQRAAARSYMLQSYQEKINSLKANAQRVAADVQGYQERLKVASELEAKRMELERLQVGSQLNRLSATDTRLEMSRSLADAQGQLQGTLRDLQAQIAERDNYLHQWVADTSQTLTQESLKLADMNSQVAHNKLRHTLVDMRAEQDAVVLSVASVSVGSVMQSGQPLVTLVPLDAPLEVEANIAGRDAGYVNVGDTVTAKLDTLPYVRFGYAEGTVRTISGDSFNASDANTTDGQGMPMQSGQPGLTASGPMMLNNVFYRVRIQIDHMRIHDTPASFHLVPGMPVTADIKVGKRTVLSYLLERVLPASMNGMREP